MLDATGAVLDSNTAIVVSGDASTTTIAANQIRYVVKRWMVKRWMVKKMDGEKDAW